MHGIARTRVQLFQLYRQSGRHFGQPRHGLNGRARGLPIAVQLQCARHMGSIDHKRDGQHRQISINKVAADNPSQGRQPDKRSDEVQVASGHEWYLSRLAGAKDCGQPVDRLETDIKLGQEYALYISAERVQPGVGCRWGDLALCRQLGLPLLLGHAQALEVSRGHRWNGPQQRAPMACGRLLYADVQHCKAREVGYPGSQ